MFGTAPSGPSLLELLPKSDLDKDLISIRRPPLNP
jgi:hypothetical protein